MILGRVVLAALATGLIFVLSFVLGFAMPHPRLVGLGAAIEVSFALDIVVPALAGLTLLSLSIEAILAWRRGQAQFRWTLSAGGLALASFGLACGLITSFNGV